MLKRSKFLWVLLVGALFFSLLVGCSDTKTDEGNGSDSESDGGSSDEGSEGDSIDVGIILPTRDEPRWVQDEQRFRDAIADSDYTTEILFSQGSSANELQNVETLISRGIDVLIMSPHDGDAAGAAAKAASMEGIKVISYDRLITNTDAVDYYVTFDSFAVGEAQGQYLIDSAGDGKDIPLYLYAGAASDNNAFLFFEGAWKTLQPKIADGTFVIANSSEAEARS